MALFISQALDTSAKDSDSRSESSTVSEILIREDSGSSESKPANHSNDDHLASDRDQKDDHPDSQKQGDHDDYSDHSPSENDQNQRRIATPKTQRLPILPLRDVVVFPSVIVPLMVGRVSSLQALEIATSGDNLILLVTQRSADVNSPEEKDLYNVGCIGRVLQCLRMPDKTVKVLIDGQMRGRASDFAREPLHDHIDQPENDDDDTEGSLTAMVTPLPVANVDSTTVDALRRSLMGIFREYVRISKRIGPDILTSLSKIQDPGRLADTIAQHMNWKISERQELLEELDVQVRVERISEMIGREVNVSNIERKIHSRVKKQIERTQQEYYLNEQAKAIQKELGEEDDTRSELQTLEKKIKGLKMTTEARNKALGELRKLRHVNAMSAESTVIRNYVEWLIAVPWKKNSRLTKNLTQAAQILDTDHYGLEKIKERILEYLAVQSRTGSVRRGAILCFVGPPGVGKTSLGRSIARATGRKFARISLGGVRDESEIRGHRRTYIGSMPGKIIQAMRKTDVSNPLILLDEIDKVGMDWRGDPSSALLEVLDPEQNVAFNDHYLDVDYDLSQVMFVTTANTLSIPRPLLDRLDVLRLSGYTEKEKIEVANRHLLPKQIKETGIKTGEIDFTSQALNQLIRRYTREAGVRNLEREIANVCRKSVLQLERERQSLFKSRQKKHSKDAKSTEGSQAFKPLIPKRNGVIRLTATNIHKFAGTPRFRHADALTQNMIGTTIGLAWMEVGGEVLIVESVLVPGRGKVVMTGKLGDVMRESVKAAESLVKSRASDFGITPEMLAQRDIHVHVPEGAVPKDGPSAGLAMVTSIVSLLSSIPVRSDVAMTGEITLQGRVLAIGGMKEKLLAALRAGIKTVLIPHENAEQTDDLPREVSRGIKIVPVKTIDEALNISLEKPFQPITWNDDEVRRIFGHISTDDQKDNDTTAHH